MSQSRLERLKTTLTNELGINLKDTNPADLAVLAEVFCTLSFKPAGFFKKSDSIVNVPSIEGEGETLNKNMTLNEFNEAVEAALAGHGEQQADEAQARVGKILAECYDDGDGELRITRDRRKAAAYGRRPAPTETRLRTEYFYSRLGWYTSFRLFFVRLNRILDAFKYGFFVDRAVDVGNEFFNTIFNAITKHAKEIAGYASLSYILELLVDFSIMLRTVFKPTPQEKENTPSDWQRFINTFKKDDRMPRMANAAVWFAINLACLFINPVLAAVLNLSLFIFDVFVDVYKYYRDKSKHEQLMVKVAARKNELEEEIKECVNGTQPQPEKAQNLKWQLLKCQRIEARLQEKDKTVREKRRRAILITSMILVGMVILLVPQFAAAAFLSVLTVKLIGASIAMLGSIIGGLGRRLYDLSTAPKPKPDVSDEEFNNINQNKKVLVRELDNSDEPANTSDTSEEQVNTSTQPVQLASTALVASLLPATSEGQDAFSVTPADIALYSRKQLRDIYRANNPCKNLERSPSAPNLRTLQKHPIRPYATDTGAPMSPPGQVERATSAPVSTYYAGTSAGYSSNLPELILDPDQDLSQSDQIMPHSGVYPDYFSRLPQEQDLHDNNAAGEGQRQGQNFTNACYRFLCRTLTAGNRQDAVRTPHYEGEAPSLDGNSSLYNFDHAASESPLTTSRSSQATSESSLTTSRSSQATSESSQTTSESSLTTTAARKVG